jgi:hypothetical protein
MGIFGVLSHAALFYPNPKRMQGMWYISKVTAHAENKSFAGHFFELQKNCHFFILMVILTEVMTCFICI